MDGTVYEHSAGLEGAPCAGQRTFPTEIWKATYERVSLAAVDQDKAGLGVDLANALAEATGVPTGRWLHAEANRLSALAARDATVPSDACHGCGSTRIVTRNRLAYCTEPTCDRRLPGPPCETCTRPRALHVCLSCSPDELTEGSGCHNCRHTGWNQTPCLPPATVTA